MCGIVGYIGKKRSQTYIVNGLKKVEYRGYDSAGFACLDENEGKLRYIKAKGSIENLVSKIKENFFDGPVGIGHTRWSTHGEASEANAHPHFDPKKSVAIVHNGIIENYSKLKSELISRGHTFYSETDTEVIAHILGLELSSSNLPKKAVLELISKLRGAYVFAALFEEHPDLMLVVRKSLPLCMGIGTDETFIASDIAAFSDYTSKVLFLPDESFAIVRAKSIEMYDFDGNRLSVKSQIKSVNTDWVSSGKNKFEHYMLKEIYEQKRVIEDTVRFYKTFGEDFWSHVGFDKEFIAELKHLKFFACGTSAHAAEIGKFFFEKIAKVHTTLEFASEFRNLPLFVDEHVLYCALSQSGETADTLEAMRMVNELNIPTLAITNVPSSSMVREANGFMLTQAKQEIAVASTKSFTAQLAILFLLSNRIAVEKNLITPSEMEFAERDLLELAEILESSIKKYESEIIERFAPHYAKFKHFIFLGRHISYPFAREAALKLKEISYLFVDCFPAGELKHGTIALIDDSTPVFIFSVLNKVVYQKLVIAAEQVKARSGYILAFAFEGQEELIAIADEVFVIPRVNKLLAPLAMTGLMQFFVYQIAKVLKRPIDKPRNLAKSVTVE